MTDKLRFYIPNKDNQGNEINPDKVINELVDLVGGLTVIPSIGYYKTESGKIVQEETKIVEISIQDYIDIKEAVIGLAYQFKHDFNQESVMLEVNQEALFI